MTMYNLIEYSDNYISYFWRILEMPLINCKINLTLTWSNRCFIIINNLIPVHEPKFTMADTKRYVSVVPLSTQDNAKLLEQLKSGFKRTINWNKYEQKVTAKERNRYLEFLINPSFQGVNRLFVLSFENTDGRTSYTRYYLPLVEIRNYDVVIDCRNLFIQPADQPAKNSLITMITFERSKLFKEMIIQLSFY